MRQLLSARHADIVKHAAHIPLPDLARQLGLGRVSLFRYLQKHGIEFVRAHSEFVGDRLAEVNEYITQNHRSSPRQRLTNAQMAAKFDCSVSYIKTLKARLDLPKLSPFKNLPDDWYEACAKLGFVADTPNPLHTAATVPVTCFCGVEFQTRVDSVLRGNVNSCGCLVSQPQNDLSTRLAALGLVVQTNVTGLLEGKREVDLYIPSHKLAVEYCGLYWHSHSRLKDIQYHYSKFDQLQARGIRLLTIFEDEWLETPEIVWSAIVAKLGLTKNKVYARKCVVVDDRARLVEFMNRSHIQGARGRVYWGLEHEGVVVAGMSFQHNTRLGDGQELSRFAVAPGWSVPGGFSRLLAAFTKANPGVPVMSLSDNRWSDGGLYLKNGFRLLRESSPTYSYIVGKKRMHKKNYSLTKLKKDGTWIEGETESEAAARMGIERIYDCGKRTFIRP